MLNNNLIYVCRVIKYVCIYFKEETEKHGSRMTMITIMSGGLPNNGEDSDMKKIDTVFRQDTDFIFLSVVSVRF